MTGDAVGGPGAAGGALGGRAVPDLAAVRHEGAPAGTSQCLVESEERGDVRGAPSSSWHASRYASCSALASADLGSRCPVGRESTWADGTVWPGIREPKTAALRAWWSAPPYTAARRQKSSTAREGRTSALRGTPAPRRHHCRVPLSRASRLGTVQGTVHALVGTERLVRKV